MAREMTVAAVQAAFSPDMSSNLEKVEALVREAASQSAQVILPPELFQSIYFPTRQDPKWFETAFPVGEHPCVRTLSALAKELGVVIPISFFEKDGPHFFNSVAIADADGAILGVYRKSHIPDGPGYQEKYYFRPGDTGFKAWRTKHGTVGVGICWDQWYPEAARLMALAGADMLIYPTAIGWNPEDDEAEKQRQLGAWQIVQRGHAVANGLPVIVPNRTGTELSPDGEKIDFWGHSFVAGPQGEILAQAPANEATTLLVDVDLQRSEEVRRIWPFLRDRRVDAYQNMIKRFID